MTARKYTVLRREVIETVPTDGGSYDILDYADRMSWGNDGHKNYCNTYTGYGTFYVNQDIINDDGSRWSMSVDMSTTSLEDLTITENDKNELIVELYNKIHDNPFDAVGAFSEIDETISGIYGNVKALSGAITALKRGDISRAARYLGIEKGPAGFPRTAAKAWLQWNFAWKPTLSAVHDGAEKLASLIDKPKTYVDDFRVTVTHTDSSSRLYGDDFTRLIHAKNSLRYAIRVATTIQNAGLPYKNKHASAARVRWERTSMSWAIDYLLPIGEYLNAVEVAPFFSSTPICSTYFEKVKGSTITQGQRMDRTNWHLKRESIYVSPVFPRMNSLNALLRPHRLANLAAVAILKLAHV